MSGQQKALKYKYIWRPGGQGSKIHVLSLELKEHKSFCPGTRAGETGDRADRTEFYVLRFYVPFVLPIMSC